MRSTTHNNPMASAMASAMAKLWQSYGKAIAKSDSDSDSDKRLTPYVCLKTGQEGIASYVSKRLETCASALEAPTIAHPKTPTDAMPDVIEGTLRWRPL